ncbi:phosphotransferase (plasmid) [Deinococcus taeanensis]|uniref:phosphotransferase family protein n=1 Tax=Deinococcus taeanensis TaxID=2737050 RepID=UPI001CDC27F9|nr:phosphotransferase [Deinococcus taeanensis]UBV44646.1 phosphotransferase [Deinococcus taeanensis]
MALEPWRQLLQSSSPLHEVLRAWPLQGGVSATVTAVELRSSTGHLQTVVVRQYGQIDRTRNPHIARDEFRLLKILQSAGLYVPGPVAFDDTARVVPGPVLITTFVEGTTEIERSALPQAVVGLAAFLLQLHQHVDRTLVTTFLPRKVTLSPWPDSPDDTLSETTIRRVLDRHWPPPLNELCMVHGDVWPGNLLWQGDRLAAVIDWEDAGISDPLLDVSNARLELLFAFGKEAMEGFTEAYRAHSQCDFSALPLWDLYAALRPAGRLHTWGLEPEAEQRMRARHRWFVEQALGDAR